MEVKTLVRIGLSLIFFIFGAIVCLTSNKNARAVAESQRLEEPITVERKLEQKNIRYVNSLEKAAKEKEAAIKEQGLVVLEDGSVLYLTLEDIVTNIATWYSEEEIDEIARMVAGENGNFESETIWSAHVWVVLNRLGKDFAGSESITGVLYSGAFDAVTLHPENMVKPVREDIRAVVVDVLARGIYESMGAPEEKVGRTLPEEFAFFRNEEFRDAHNHFYDDWNGGREYDPFSAPYNPYIT